jgi:hypothetical protein
METWITWSIVALAPMLLRSPKALLPLRVSAGDSSRFAGLFRRYAIHSFTGYASDVGKRSDTYTEGSIKSAMGTDGHPASVDGSVQSHVVVTDRFFLTDAQGKIESFEGAGFEANVGNGHLVSLAWLIKGFAKSGPCFLIYNHSTGEAFFNDEAIRKKLTFPYPALYVAILLLMILPIPVVVFFGVLAMAQKFLFERSGVKPLVSTLEAQAATLPPRPEAASQQPVAPQPAQSTDMATSLREISALRDSGALSEAEFAAAKAKVLRRGT